MSYPYGPYAAQQQVVLVPYYQPQQALQPQQAQKVRQAIMEAGNTLSKINPLRTQDKGWFTGKNIAIGTGVAAVAAVLLAWATGWIGGGDNKEASAAGNDGADTPADKPSEC